MANYGTDRVVLQDTTGAIMSESGNPLFSTDSEGASAYTLGPSLTRELLGGIANGDFSSPTSSIGTATPISSNNDLPFYSFSDNSSGRVALSIIEDSASSSGFALNIKLTNAQAGDYAYIERIIPILSTKNQAMTYIFTAYNSAGSVAPVSGTTLQMEAQYLKSDGTTTTGGGGTASGSFIVAESKSVFADTTGVAPSDAAFLRVRIGGRDGMGFTGVSETTVYEMRLETGNARTIITDDTNPNTYSFGSLVQTNGTLKIAGPSVNSFISIGTANIAISPRIPSGTVSMGGTVGFSETANFNGGSVNFGADVNLYRNDPSVLRTDDRFVIGSRTSASVNQVDAPGALVDAAAGFAWVDRSPNTSATDSSLFLSSGYFNGNLQMVRFFRKITVGGTALTGTGHILVANNATTAPSFGAGSDYRLKDDIRDASDEINFVEKINDLRPVLYTETGSGDEDLLGFIAHEVQAVIPNAVEGAKDAVDENGDPAYQMLYPAKFIPYLVGAVRELTARIEELEAKVAALESEE